MTRDTKISVMAQMVPIVNPILCEIVNGVWKKDVLEFGDIVLLLLLLLLSLLLLSLLLLLSMLTLLLLGNFLVCFMLLFFLSPLLLSRLR